MAIVAQLVPALYLLFTVQADWFAASTGFIRRVRGFRGRDFLQALVFGWLRRPHASLEDLAHPLGISRQALEQRFTPQAVAFAQAVLRAAVQKVFQAQPPAVGCLRGFRGVFIDDCTQVWLPDAAAATDPGCGGAWTTGPKARLKILLRWELQGGQFHHLTLHPGRTADLTALAGAPPLPEGCLHLADLAFLDFDRLRQESAAGVFWITRLPAQVRAVLPDTADADGEPLWQRLRRWRQQGQRPVDSAARIGEGGAVAGRLLARACPPGVVARRLARLKQDAAKRRRPVSERQQELCHWLVLFTNVPSEQLTAAQVVQAYRLRWQIELLVKRCKSEGGLGTTTSSNEHRVLVEWCLKLVGQVVRNWLHLLRGGPLQDVNQRHLGHVIADQLGDLAPALRQGVVAVWDVVVALWEALARVRPRTRRRQRPSAAQELADGEGGGSGTEAAGKDGPNPATAPQPLAVEVTLEPA